MREYSKNPVWPWQYNTVPTIKEWHAIDYWMEKNPGRPVPLSCRKKMDFSKIEERCKE